MGQGYGTETGVMTSVAGRLDAINGELQTQLTGLKTRLEPLVAEWQGQGSNAFQGTMTRWDADARRINESLRGIAERVRAGGNRYQVNESDAAGLLNILSDQGGATGGGGAAPGGGAISSALGPA